MADKKIRDQIKSNNLLLDKLKVVKQKVEVNRDSVVDIESFIEFLGNPGGDVDRVVRLVDRQKPLGRPEKLPSDEETEVEPNPNIGSLDEDDKDDDLKEIPKISSKPVIPVLVFSCNRVTVSRALDLLITYRPSKEQFPIIVSQDCNHSETR